MKRPFDIVLALTAILFLILPATVLSIVIWTTSPGPILYWSDRVGRNNNIFKMPKFRSMYVNAPIVATHLLHEPDKWVTPAGRFLRRSSLDEIPQLWNILRGEMSFVGPRPALFNQKDLIKLRTDKGVHELLPGLTGWAQINGRDDLPLFQKVEYDAEYLKKQSFRFDVKIILITVFKVLNKEGIRN